MPTQLFIQIARFMHFFESARDELHQERQSNKKNLHFFPSFAGKALDETHIKSRKMRNIILASAPPAIDPAHTMASTE
ncbi:hypothetical protein [Herbaspirillum rubrisubalbicans]|uniref:hypothetical protein n=1 Tax=Herbaspirillum rubrisubalbicans TaxID=80842 RepID=UPI0015C534B9|nr:hypothetical protein [Herbaspirillum rubrisubalbicans]